MNINFHTESPLFLGLKEIYRQFSEKALLKQPLNVYLAGGMAAHLYTATRVTRDIDAEYGVRVLVPQNLQTVVKLEDGKEVLMYLDTNYSPTLGLMHEDYLDDAIAVDLDLPMIRLHVLSPVDLVVSKISRLADPDKSDILAIVRAGLTTGKEIEERANEAISYYVGNETPVRQNLADVVRWANEELAAQNKTQAITSFLSTVGLKDVKDVKPTGGKPSPGKK